MRRLACSALFACAMVAQGVAHAQDVKAEGAGGSPAAPAATAGAAAAPATAGSAAAAGNAATATPALVTPARLTGIETNREMIAAEAETIVVVNGEKGVHCGIAVDFGDGANTTVAVSDATPFPLKLAHTYPKTGDVTIRVKGADVGTAPACLGALDATAHISPAGSKIEYITLSTSCPEGWKLKGSIAADKSFACTPVPDASAPTNLIHCIDGMKYFAKNGMIGCAHPVMVAAVHPAHPATPAGKGKAPAHKSSGVAATGARAPDIAGKKPSAAPADKAAPANKAVADTKAKPKAKPREKSATGSESPA